MIQISACIVHHPARDISALLEKLNDRAIMVVTDEEPDIADCWPNTERAWILGWNANCDYHLMMENDILPCGDFLESAKRAITAKAGAPMVKFYSPQEIMAEAISFNRARELGKKWVLLDYWCGHQAVALRTDLIADFINWQRGPNYPDARLLEWTRYKKIKVWQTIPSLVEHIGTTSLMGLGMHTANDFIGADKSALDIDWSHA
jgi:hypothetical protein